MKSPTQKQIEEAHEKGKDDALAGHPGAPSGFDHWELIQAWMQGYDSIGANEHQNPSKDWCDE